MVEMTTWRNEIEMAMHNRGETWADIESCTLTDEQLDRRFDAGYGTAEDDPFTVWTAKTVYFPVEYDGSEKVGCVSRNPDGKPTEHIG